jgi:hypothetical protein
MTQKNLQSFHHKGKLINLKNKHFMKNYFWVVTYEITILEKTFKYKVRNIEAVSSKQAKEKADAIIKTIKLENDIYIMRPKKQTK